MLLRNLIYLIYAAIDIGSNAVRLLIQEAVFDGNEKTFYFKKIGLTRVPIRLGNDVFTSGEISKENTLNIINAFKAFKLLMKINKVDFFRACATSAMRESTNGENIVQKVLENTGVKIDLISGKEEADLIFSNFHFAELNKSTNYIYIDVGGGSTELTIIKENNRIAAKSFKIGSVRMLKNNVDNNVWPNIYSWIEQQNISNENFTAIGTGGSINKLYNLSSKKFKEPIHIDELLAVVKYIAAFSFDDRIIKLALKPDRADVIIPSGEIYAKVMKAFKATQMIVPKVGLSDGMIYNLFLDNEINSKKI